MSTNRQLDLFFENLYIDPAVAALLNEIKPSRCRCYIIMMHVVRCTRFWFAGETVLAAGTVWLLLSFAQAIVFEVPHDPAYCGTAGHQF